MDGHRHSSQYVVTLKHEACSIGYDLDIALIVITISAIWFESGFAKISTSLELLSCVLFFGCDLYNNVFMRLFAKILDSDPRHYRQLHASSLVAGLGYAYGFSVISLVHIPPSDLD